ncbi:saxitoxin and tetrodotoxin-binding protein 1-like [Genypterus blacodes]|uniref:saxitoxin and tetrodotoxin-binding protein 1-like n=1 Tax=Genypterus blacodes TaxID=154954 RepID=UPI003F775CB1
MFVRRVAVLLLLAALSCCAHGACEAQNNTLPTSDLDKVFGAWVLVWAASDHVPSPEILTNLSSSHVELKLNDDNQTISYIEKNLFSGDVCKMYKANTTVTSDPQDSRLTIGVVSAVEEVSGVQSVYNDSAEVFFYQSCSECLMMMYKSQMGPRYMMNYRRMGKHSYLSELKVSEDEGVQLAQCLDFKVVSTFRFTGAAGFCHETNPAEVQPQAS